MSWHGRTFEPPGDSAEEPPLRCSFCGRLESDVGRIVCGPTRAVAICNECVVLVAEVMSESQEQPPAAN